MKKSELEKIRDEWSIKFAEECVNICCGSMSIKMAPTDVVRTASKFSFKAAFSSATALLLPEIEKLQDKLYHESRRSDEVAYLKNQEIESLQAKLKVACDALEFYGNEKSWDDRILRLGDNEPTKNHAACGGKRAREALAELRKKE